MPLIMKLVAVKLNRRLERFEEEMFVFSRKCAVCYERNGWLLEDCQNCFSASFCKKHKGNIEHKDFCDALKLCLHFNLSAIKKLHLNIDYLRHVPDVNTFQNMNDYVNTSFLLYKRTRNIQTPTTISHDIFTVAHSQYLSFPLTLFHAMRILDYVPKRKDLIIHVIAVTNIEESTDMGPVWEILLHLIEPAISLVIVMVGPELKCKSNPIQLSIYDNCIAEKKKVLLEFHNMLYENYACSPLFVNPDLIVEFNGYLDLKEQIEHMETRMPCVQLLTKQNCPFVLLTCCMEELEQEVERINTILGRKVDYLYNGKNPFASLMPHRTPWQEQVFYENCYIIVYRNFCS